MLTVTMVDPLHICSSTSQPQMLTIAAVLDTSNKRRMLCSRQRYLLYYCTFRLHLLLVPAYHVYSKVHNGELSRHTKLSGEVLRARSSGPSDLVRLKCSQSQLHQAILAFGCCTTVATLDKTCCLRQKIIASLCIIKSIKSHDVTGCGILAAATVPRLNMAMQVEQQVCFSDSPKVYVSNTPRRPRYA